VTGAKRLSRVLLALVALSAGTGAGFGQSQQAGPPADAPTPASQEGGPVHVSSGFMTGLLIKKVNPEYPSKAHDKRIQGQVVMHALISKDGDIADLSLVSGDPLLAKSAMKAVRQWKYKPYLRNGTLVEVDTQILVNFTLSGN
jgi:periplasmic protein TonB